MSDAPQLAVADIRQVTGPSPTGSNTMTVTHIPTGITVGPIPFERDERGTRDALVERLAVKVADAARLAERDASVA